MKTAKKTVARTRRHFRVRKRVRGSAERPRLAVFRSNSQIYAQLIDDVAGATLVSASSLEADVRQGTKSERAKKVGALIGERAKQAGIDAVVFDRGGNRYHGRVAQLAEGAREAGLTF